MTSSHCVTCRCRCHPYCHCAMGVVRGHTECCQKQLQKHLGGFVSGEEVARVPRALMGFNCPEEPHLLRSSSPYSWPRSSHGAWLCSAVSSCLQPGLQSCCLGFLDWPEPWLVLLPCLLVVGLFAGPAASTLLRYCPWGAVLLLIKGTCQKKGEGKSLVPSCVGTVTKEAKRKWKR